VDADGKDNAELFSRAIAAFDELRRRAEATLSQLQAANRPSETRTSSGTSLRVDVRTEPAEPSAPSAPIGEEVEEEPARPNQGARAHAQRRP
jgi:hypothetical protein